MTQNKEDKKEKSLEQQLDEAHGRIDVYRSQHNRFMIQIERLKGEVEYQRQFCDNLASKHMTEITDLKADVKRLEMELGQKHYK